MSEKILEALKTLDPANDEHWTADGAPKLSALGIKDVTRQEVVKVAPHFTKTNPTFETPSQAEARKEVETAERVKLSAVEAAAKKVDDATKKVEAIELKRRDILIELQKALAEQDLANMELRRLQGPHDNQRTIMEYLASIKADREARTAPKE